MGSCASFPSENQSRSEETFVSNDSFECALYATYGRRPRMEDNHTIALSLPNHPAYSVFGVFDGFNGDDASTYFSTNLVDTLNKVDDLRDNDAIIQAIGEMDTNFLLSPDHNTNAGCTFVFALVDQLDPEISESSRLLNISHSNHSNSSSETSIAHSSISERKTADDFSTVLGGEHGFRVRVFWAGDSRAVLMSSTNNKNGSNDTSFARFTEDHHTSCPQEAERIIKANGTIVNDRIDGIVEVTRCFGCHPMKNDVSLSSNQQKMISVPEYTTILCGRDDRLLIFCDGLTKKWSDDQFNVRCAHHVSQHDDEKNGSVYALKYLCEQAMDEGSDDNISVISVKFK
eukprot:109079_1